MFFHLVDSFVLRPFAELSTEKQHEQILSWFVGSEYAREAVNGNIVITEDIKITSRAPDSVLDPQVKIELVQTYCLEKVFNLIKALVNERKRNKKTWKCGTCEKRLLGRSIICEKCLRWSHFTCTSFNETPDGDWFCDSCVENMAQGNYYE